MRVRAAVVEDASAMGCLMVEAYLSAHRDQLPDAAWQRRVDEWTPEVSARAWARTITEQGGNKAARDVVLVAEDDASLVCGLASGTAADDDLSGSVAEISALYVLPDRQGQGIGGSLLRAAAGELARLGFAGLQISVLTANLAARGFYEAMAGREIGRGTFDEEGHQLPVTVYGWPDMTALIGHPRVTS